MGFGLGMETEKLQERAVNGRYMKVAVGCWFTSTGKAIPKMVKYEDEEKLQHTLNRIEVLKSDKKHYAGIYSQRYDCCVVEAGVRRYFTLLYHPGDNTWDMVISQ